MANYKALIPHMLKWEGGYSSDNTDDARFDATTKLLKGYPIHTYKGVTFGTWKNTAKELGHSPSEEAFLNMTSSEWGKIMKKFYWNYVFGDKIQSQAIAEILTEIVWGSGPKYLKPIVIKLQKLLQEKGYDPKGIDGRMGTDTVNAINKYVYDKGAKGEKELVDFIWNNRVEQLKTFSTAKYHLKGWMNRMNDWYSNASDRIKQFIKDNPTGSGILGVSIVLFGVFLLGKKFIK
jgi:lysozyme family protein